MVVGLINKHTFKNSSDHISHRCYGTSNTTQIKDAPPHIPVPGTYIMWGVKCGSDYIASKISVLV